MKTRDQIMNQVTGPDTFAIHYASAILEVLLDIREQNFKIEARLETLSERSLPPQTPR